MGKERRVIFNSAALIWFTTRAWRQGCETRAAQLGCGQEGFGDGEKFVYKVLLLTWKQLPPLMDTQSLPAQLLAQASPKIPSKDRGSLSPGP